MEVDPIHVPPIGHAPERMLTDMVEDETALRHEVLHGLRDRPDQISWRPFSKGASSTVPYSKTR
jgi:hypothetical protein